MFDFLPDVPGLVGSPLALIGYVGLGILATSALRALWYGALWSLAIHVVALATGPPAPGAFEAMATAAAARVAGGAVITLAAWWLYRRLRQHRRRTRRARAIPRRPR